MMKFVYAVSFAFSLALFAAAGAARADTALQSLYQAAKAEGQVIFWTPLDPPEVRMLAEDVTRNGGRVVQDEIQDFEIGAEGPKAAIGNNGRYPFDAVVVTAGAWSRGKAFVDFQNDVTSKDLKLATREGFRSIEHVKRALRERRDALIEALHRYVGPDASFVAPEGGYFLWVELPEEVDAEQLLAAASERGVVFVNLHLLDLFDKQVTSAFAPLTKSVQSPLLSSIQRPTAFCLTMRPTRGGAGFAGLSGGLKLAPSFGGGFWPPYGPAGLLTTFGGKPRFICAPPPAAGRPVRHGCTWSTARARSPY